MMSYLLKLWIFFARTFSARAPEEVHLAAQMPEQLRVESEVDAFAAQMLERLRAAKPETEYSLSATDPLAIEMKHDEKFGEGVINLHRLYAFCQSATAEDREAELAEFVRKLIAPISAPTPADLRVIVRNREYLNYILGTLPDLNQPPYRQIGDDLFAIIAFDHPDNIALAGGAQLRDLGLTDAVAWQVAEDQTRSILPPLPDVEELAKKVTTLYGGDYLVSLLADTNAWQVISDRAGPHLFATAVSNLCMSVGIIPDGQSFDGFKQSVRDDYETQQRGVSPNVYRFRDGRWKIAD